MTFLISSCYICNLVTRNQSNDFSFIAYGSGALGGGSTYCKLYPITNNNKIFSRSDTSLGYPGTQYIVNVPMSLLYNDSIYYSANYSDNYSFLWSGAYGYESAPSINDWNNIGDKYIGVSLDIGNDTLLGWIKVNVSFTDYIHKLTIKDFACNKNPNNIVKVDKINSIIIYPNPFKNIITISLPESINIGSLSVLSIDGQLLFQKALINKITPINLNDLQIGIYILKIEIEDRVSFQKIVKDN